MAIGKLKRAGEKGMDVPKACPLDRGSCTESMRSNALNQRCLKIKRKEGLTVGESPVLAFIAPEWQGKLYLCKICPSNLSASLKLPFAALLSCAWS